MIASKVKGYDEENAVVGLQLDVRMTAPKAIVRMLGDWGEGFVQFAADETALEKHNFGKAQCMLAST